MLGVFGQKSVIKISFIHLVLQQQKKCFEETYILSLLLLSWAVLLPPPPAYLRPSSTFGNYPIRLKVKWPFSPSLFISRTPHDPDPVCPPICIWLLPFAHWFCPLSGGAGDVDLDIARCHCPAMSLILFDYCLEDFERQVDTLLSTPTFLVQVFVPANKGMTH